MVLPPGMRGQIFSEAHHDAYIFFDVSDRRIALEAEKTTEESGRVFVVCMEAVLVVALMNAANRALPALDLVGPVVVQRRERRSALVFDAVLLPVLVAP